MLIDASPDLRQQLLDADVQHLDALVFTHDHADQSHGIDDVRALSLRMRKQIPTYMDAATAETLTRRFDYCFEGKGGYPPILRLEPLVTPGTPFEVTGPAGTLKLLPLEQVHGRIMSLGFRIGSLAYCNDVSEIPSSSMEMLHGVETLIVDALRYTPHPSHAHLERALEWIDQISPKRAYLTNMHIDLDYGQLLRELPPHIRPGFDGLSIEFKA